MTSFRRLMVVRSGTARHGSDGDGDGGERLSAVGPGHVAHAVDHHLRGVDVGRQQLRVAALAGAASNHTASCAASIIALVGVASAANAARAIRRNLLSAAARIRVNPAASEKLAYPLLRERQPVLGVVRSGANDCRTALCQRRKPPKAVAEGQRLQGAGRQSILNDRRRQLTAVAGGVNPDKAGVQPQGGCPPGRVT